MKFATVFVFLTMLNSIVVFDFTKNSDLDNWYILNDNVMGGMSKSSFNLNDKGNLIFTGTVSLENNGGFASLRYNFTKLDVIDNKKIVIRLKGDGKEYQFRIKSKRNDYYSFISSFSTSGKWQNIEIPLKDMYPGFRGRKLDIGNFADESIEEIAFLIGNKKNESFLLEIDKIELK